MGTDTSKSLFDQALKEILATNYVAAELLLQQASEINEESTTLYAACWAVLLALRDRDLEAVEILEERLEDFSTDPNLLMAYGITLERQGKYDEAEDAFRESLTAEPENPGALRGLSTCLSRKGDLVGACRLAAQAFALSPDNLVLAKNAAQLLEKAGQKNTAHEVLELGAHYNPEDEELVVKALESCLRRGLLDRAWEILTLVDETQSWAASWKASFLDWRGETARVDHIIQATLQRPGGEDNNFLFHLCCILMRRGEIAAAENYIEHILASDPQHPGALRMRADFSVGRFDYNPVIDPLAAAIDASTETPGWARFWSLLNSGSVEEAEETLAALSEDEEFISDPLEVARLELAEQLFLVLSTGEGAESELHALDELPSEAACGVLLEFLEVLDGVFANQDVAGDFRLVLNEELGRRDPWLRLTRFYALGQWDSLKDALQDFEAEAPTGDEQEEEPPGRKIVHRLYTLLHALGTGAEQTVEEFEYETDPDFARQVYDVLVQKQEKNPTEQRFLHKLQGQMQKLTVRQVPEPVKTDDSPQLYGVGGVLDSRDVEIIIYETEDGEVITDFNEDDFEVIGEAEPDPDDDDYEYVWVEEEILEEEDFPEDDGSKVV